ncbi:cytochrome P450 4C1-like [Zerene cesonia]|uniref:cytochrome P450 4C1-like n=1 Tax=Zerene cesonia TaxID=33412 RepID=UPI0018E557C0|nr:cytochrome P450 4C1-like [Zerene cesonia]XP_038219475.1 cytochrome P450 4C1-like [Zerene cesonia]
MLAVILIIIVCGLWAWSRVRRNYNEPPAIPGGLPLVGHAHLLVGDSIQLWTTVKELSYECLRLGGVLSATIGPRTIYIVCDPDDALTVANSCLQKDTFYEFAKPWLGEGLVTGKLSIWKHHRRLLNPAFSSIVLDGFLGVFNSQSRRLVQELSKEVGKGPFDHWVYTRHNALETICLTALGIDFTEKSVLNSQYVQATEQIFNVFVERFQKFWLHNHFIYSLSGLRRKQDNLLKILHNMSYTVLQKRKADYLKSLESGYKEDKTGTKFKPFMDLLLELSVEKGAFNDREIQEHVDTMIVGGHDTSASVLMFTLVLIGSHPHVQEKIYEELRVVFGSDDRDVTKQDLSQLVYLEAVLKESMRIFPIVPVTARILDRDIKLKHCTLSKGRTCFMFVHGIHRHPMWGPDAEEFKPERWLNPLTLPDCPTAFAAFNMGRRICIGKSYAYMSMKTSLAHVMRHYKVQGDHTKLVLKIDVMLKPEEGHYISIERRS